MIRVYGILEYGGQERNWRLGGECLAPSVSVKDHSLSSPVDRV